MPKFRCTECIHTEKDGVEVLYCSVTGKPSAESQECPYYEDLEGQVEVEDVEESVMVPKGVPDEEITRILQSQQDFGFAVLGGLVVTLCCAFLWAAVTVITEYQTGFGAIVVGLIIGYSIAFFGGGIDKKFGYLGAFLGFFACFLGNLLSQVVFLAQQMYSSYIEALLSLDIESVWSLITVSFAPIDFFLYAFAVYEGYKLAFRKVNDETLRQIRSYESEGVPKSFRHRRIALVIGLLIIAATLYYANQGVNGLHVLNYPSGNQQAKGEFRDSHEVGYWTYWYENGKIQSEGFYKEGIPDSAWKWYYEDGSIYRTGYYRTGMETGTWISYHPNGKIADSGLYDAGRRTGKWISRYPTGILMTKGEYYLDMQNGIWENYFDDGKLQSVGMIEKQVPTGNWKYYYPNGKLAEEKLFDSSGKDKILNSWSPEGQAMVKDGNGFYSVYHDNGSILLSGDVKNGLRFGLWKSWFIQGHLKETGRFEEDEYFIIDAWDRDGNQQVRNGNGQYIIYQPDDSTTAMIGQIKDGCRTGIWKGFSADGGILQEFRYDKNHLDGNQKFFYEGGMPYSQGEMKQDNREGKWVWYATNGNVISEAFFRNNLKEGIQQIWDINHKLRRSETYEHGILKSFKEYTD